MVLDGKWLQEYLVSVEVPQGSFLGPTLLMLYIAEQLDDIICSIAIFADGIFLDCRRNKASDLWQQIKSASERKSDLRDTVEWGRK